MVAFQYASKMKRLLLLFCIGSLVLAGCSSNIKVNVPPGFKAPDQETVYIAPFINTLVPDTVTEPVFNEFVDFLNRKRNIPGIKFFAIIKDELKDVDPRWLEKQAYISGELWSYIENSGCCSTEIRIKSRINVHQPGQQTSLEIFLPKESFFEHDRSSIDVERSKFSQQLAHELAEQVMKVLTPQH